MSRTLSIPVSDALFSKLQLRAKLIGNGTKAEDVAEDWLEQRGREVPDLQLRFLEAGKKVDQLLAYEEAENVARNLTRTPE